MKRSGTPATATDMTSWLHKMADEATATEAAALEKLDEVVNHFDSDAICGEPGCGKEKWGEEHHGPECIFRGAYDFLADPFPAAQRLLDIAEAAKQLCLVLLLQGEIGKESQSAAQLLEACGFEQVAAGS